MDVDFLIKIIAQWSKKKPINLGLLHTFELMSYLIVLIVYRCYCHVLEAVAGPHRKY